MRKTPGELMRDARKRAGKTQADIAAELDVTQACVSQWESGSLSYPAKDIPRIAGVYGLRPEQLVPRESAA